MSVRGEVYPGTYIEICHVLHFITRPQRLLSFRLDKEKGKIMEAKWEKSTPLVSREKRPPLSSA